MRNHKRTFANIFAASIAVLVLALLTLLSSRLSLPTSAAAWLLLVAAVASLAGYFFGALPLARHFVDRWVAALPLRGKDRVKRRIVLVGYTVLFVLVLILFILFLIDLYLLWIGHQVFPTTPRLATLYYRISVPSLTLLVALALLYKLRAATMLDRQKQGLVRILLPLDDPNILGAAGPLLMLPPPTLPPDTPAERHFLEDLCEKVTAAATKVGLQVSSPKGGSVVSGIFIADLQSRHFVPVATHGGGAWYETAMETFRPPFLDFERFRAIYQEYTRRMAKEEPRNRQAFLHDFRTAASGVVSNCGLVFALERKFAFGPSLYTRCVAHRFEFLDRIPESERDPYMFEESVGLPITILGRKIGVFLLLSNRVGTFYPRDRGLYTALARLLSLGVRCLFQTRAIEKWIPAAKWEDYPLIGSDESRRQEIVRFVNMITPNFRWRG